MIDPNGEFFLTDAEMRRLTGYTSFEKQKRILSENGWVFFPTAVPKSNKRGVTKPTVARAYALQKLGMKLDLKLVPAKAPEPEWKPDFSDLRNGTATV